MHHQHGQQRPLLGPAQRERAVLTDNLERPQNAELNHRVWPRHNRTSRPKAGLTAAALPIRDRFSTASRPPERTVRTTTDRTAAIENQQEAVAMSTTHRIATTAVLILSLAATGAPAASAMPARGEPAGAPKPAPAAAYSRQDKSMIPATATTRKDACEHPDDLRATLRGRVRRRIRLRHRRPHRCPRRRR